MFHRHSCRPLHYRHHCYWWVTSESNQVCRSVWFTVRCSHQCCSSPNNFFGRGCKNRTYDLGIKIRCDTISLIPNSYLNCVICTICYAHAGWSRITAIIYIVTQAWSSPWLTDNTIKPTKNWLRIRESNSTNQWLTVTPMHLARVLRNNSGDT